DEDEEELLNINEERKATEFPEFIQLRKRPRIESPTMIPSNQKEQVESADRPGTAFTKSASSTATLTNPTSMPPWENFSPFPSRFFRESFSATESLQTFMALRKQAPYFEQHYSKSLHQSTVRS